jgi:8-oxo-dGTP diphosphatase
VALQIDFERPHQGSFLFGILTSMITSDFDEEATRKHAIDDGVTHFATGIAIFRDGKLLVARREVNDYLGGVYELPGGGVDEGETITEGAIRETYEETGLVVAKVLGTFEGFDYRTNSKPKVRQINFKVEVEPGDVKLEPNEHDDYQWITEDEIAQLKTTDVMKDCLRSAFKP